MLRKTEMPRKIEMANPQIVPYFSSQVLRIQPNIDKLIKRKTKLSNKKQKMKGKVHYNLVKLIN